MFRSVWSRITSQTTKQQHCHWCHWRVGMPFENSAVSMKIMHLENGMNELDVLFYPCYFSSRIEPCSLEPVEALVKLPLKWLIASLTFLVSNISVSPIQLCTNLSMESTALCSADSSEYLRQLGAGDVVDYKQTNWLTELVNKPK